MLQMKLLNLPAFISKPFSTTTYVCSSSWLVATNATYCNNQVYVHGQNIRWKDNVQYLGNVLACDMCDAADIRVKKGEFIGSVNRLKCSISCCSQ